MKSFWGSLDSGARDLFRRLRGGHLTKERLSRSVGVGLFIGTLPLYGFHLPLCALASLALGLDVLVTYAAANISIPPLIPVLLYGSVQIGSFVLTGNFREHTLEDVRRNSLLATGEQLAVGSVLLGLGLGLVGALVSYGVARALSGHRRSELDELCARVTSCYRATPRAHRHYVSAKLRWDPLTSELFELARRGLVRGDVADLGAGRGQFSLFLATCARLDTIVGFDHDTTKVDVARQAAAHAAVSARFEVGDLRTFPVPPADVVLLLDVLHYLGPDEQAEVVRRAAGSLRSGGVLLLRETNRRASRGAAWARSFERIGRALGVNRGERLAFLGPDDYREMLSRAGLEVEAHEGRGALDNVLLVARRSLAASASVSGDLEDTGERSILEIDER